MSNVNEPLDIVRSEMKNVNLRVSFLLRDFFKSYKWNKISRSGYFLLETLFPKFIHITDRKGVSIERNYLGQKKYTINNKKGGFS